MNPRISLVTLGVTDLARSIAFYRDGLKLPLRDVAPGVAFFELAGTWLSLFPRHELARDATVSPAGEGFRGFTIAHNVGTRAEVDAVLAEATRSGATLIKPARDAEWGGYSGYFADPDGFLWEVAWNPGMPELAGSL
jgi:catechol 2,3-dioxygenase-like lactoylglutathione lyase family enzyme